MKLIEVYSEKEKRQQLCESVCIDMYPSQRRIIEGIFKEFTPLYEVELSPQQIQQLFKNTEQAAASAGQNRTTIGKGVDVAKKADEVINNIGKWLQNTTPVQNFDQKFEDLKSTIVTKFPDNKIVAGIENIGTFASENPGITSAIIGILTAIAALSTGPVGGAIAGQVLRGSAELLKGEKLSTAIGKGVKTAAYGWLTGQAIGLIGDALSQPLQIVSDQMHPDVKILDCTSIINDVNGEIGNQQEFTTGTLFGRTEDLNDIKTVWEDAVNSWKEGDYLRADHNFKAAAEMSAQLSDIDYLVGIGLEELEAQKYANSARSVIQFFNGMGEISQGAVAAASSNSKNQTTAESVIYSSSEILAIFESVEVFSTSTKLWENYQIATEAGVADYLSQVGKNLTNKITADKLEKAWKKSGSPTDSEQIAAILKYQGVDDVTINNAFQSINIAKQSSTASPSGSPGSSKFSAIIDKLTPEQKTQLIQQIDSIDKGKSSMDMGKLSTSTSPQQATVIKTTDPIVVQYQGKNYMLNDRGEWAVNASNSLAAQAPGAVQSILDKAAQEKGLI